MQNIIFCMKQKKNIMFKQGHKLKVWIYLKYMV